MKSPIEAPSGRVRMYASQNDRTALIRSVKCASAIRAIALPQITTDSP